MHRNAITFSICKESTLFHNPKPVKRAKEENEKKKKKRNLHPEDVREDDSARSSADRALRLGTYSTLEFSRHLLHLLRTARIIPIMEISPAFNLRGNGNQANLIASLLYLWYRRQSNLICQTYPFKRLSLRRCDSNSPTCSSNMSSKTRSRHFSLRGGYQDTRCLS